MSADGPTRECLRLYRELTQVCTTFELRHQSHRGDLVRVVWVAILGGTSYGGSADLFLPHPRIAGTPEHWAGVRRKVFDLLTEAYKKIMAVARRRNLQYGAN